MPSTPAHCPNGALGWKGLCYWRSCAVQICNPQVSTQHANTHTHTHTHTHPHPHTHTHARTRAHTYTPAWSCQTQIWAAAAAPSGLAQWPASALQSGSPASWIAAAAAAAAGGALPPAAAVEAVAVADLQTI
eukprot:1154015-Pelagomonas_calceolata.AAC.11